jgi:tetratricopeptide (TPR) repeat protein
VSPLRLWRSRGDGPRPRTAPALFGQADRLRREGRAAEAAPLVARGLILDPASLTGHLLAGYLHAARRMIEPARTEFRWVLARDPAHPRALLGLARVELETGDVEGCRQTLARALHAHPDFPEARALLDGLSAPAPEAPPTELRLDRLRLPELARAVFAVDGDGAMLAARPTSAVDEGRRLARAVGLAAAALGRAHLGPLRRAVVEDTDDRHFVRADTALTLALSLPRATAVTQGLLEVNRLWAAARHELALARGETAIARRVS